MGKSSRRHYQKMTSVALAIALPTLTMAAEESALPTIKVKAEGEPTYTVPKVQSSKYTEPLVDTPKTVTVLTAQNLKDQNLLSLRDALSTTPGITFGAGEGGGGYGDKINIRGFDSTYDTTVDGLRDSALTSRTDIFNNESIEVVKGSSSSTNGTGSVGGSVNLVSKAPRGRDFNEVNVGVGTDNYYRITGDFNKKLSETVAARLNVMGHQNDVPGRDVEKKERWGIAPSISFGLGTDTRTTFSYFHQTDNNTPQYGVPFYNGRAVPGIGSEKYYGYSNLDDQDIQTDYFTAKIESDLSDNIKLNSIARIGRVEQDTTVSAPQGTFCLANGTAPTGKTDIATVASGVTTPAYPSGYRPCTTPGQYVISGPRGYVRDSVNRVIANDSNVVWNFNTGTVAHALVTGISVTREEYDLEVGGHLYNANGTVSVRPNMDVYQPSHVYTGEQNYFISAITTGQQETHSAYVFDTLKLLPKLDLNLGVRYDNVEGRTQTNSYTETVNGVNFVRRSLPAAGVGEVFRNRDDLVSYNGAVIFKPSANSSLYASYANAQTPSKASVNGSCSAATCNVDPEEAETYEVGGKWQANSDLLLTAAIFRTERTNYKVADPANPANPAGYQVLDGSSRVQGVEIGAAGKILPQWNVYGAFAYLDSEVLQGASNRQATLGLDYSKGDHLTGTPELSGSLWTTYDVTEQWQLGYGFTYQGTQYVSQHSATAVHIPQQKAEDYWVHNASVTYKHSADISVQLNIKNILDEEYYTTGRNNGWALPGEGRAGVINLSYKF